MWDAMILARCKAPDCNTDFPRDTRGGVAGQTFPQAVGKEGHSCRRWCARRNDLRAERERHQSLAERVFSLAGLCEWSERLLQTIFLLDRETT
jgi:hypothetical protein